MTRQGFSLPEVVLCCALISVISLLIFGLFDQGRILYGRVSGRQSLESEGRRTMSRLELDFRRADIELVRVLNDATRQITGADGRARQRHAVCLPSLQDWEASASYDSDGRPLWDRYLSIYATTEPVGRLVWQAFGPPGAPYQTAWGGWGPTLLTSNPSTHAGAQVTRVLGSSVDEFALQPAPNGLAYGVNLVLTTPDHQHSMQLQATYTLENTSRR